MNEASDVLADFLRAHRARVRPEDHGMPGTARRTPGLRREEVAVLAGISTDYYVRLEQGRDKHPSPQVVEALSEVFALDEDAASYLRAIARPKTRNRGRSQRESADPSLVRLMDRWTDTPAVVLGRHSDLLAANHLGAALFSWLGTETNLVRAVFLNPLAREVYPDWEQTAANCVAGLRAAVCADIDEALTVLVGELSLRSDDFARLWARHEVRRKTAEVRTLRHPDVGELELGHQDFTVDGAPGQHMVVYHAAPGSPTERSLALLGSLAASSPSSL